MALYLPRRSPSTEAAIAFEEQVADLKSKGRQGEDGRTRAELLWDAGRELGRGEGRAQAGAAVLARDLRTLAAELVAASRDADELTLRSLCERVADELTNPIRPEPSARTAPGDSSV